MYFSFRKTTLRYVSPARDLRTSLVITFQCLLSYLLFCLLICLLGKWCLYFCKPSARTEQQCNYNFFKQSQVSSAILLFFWLVEKAVRFILIHIPYVCHYNLIFIRNRSLILTLHKARTLWKKAPLNTCFWHSKWVKNIQAPGYDGVGMVFNIGEDPDTNLYQNVLNPNGMEEFGWDNTPLHQYTSRFFHPTFL